MAHSCRAWSLLQDRSINSLHPAKNLAIREANKKHGETWISKMQKVYISNPLWLFTDEHYLHDDAMSE
jgi:hypothetical protein